MTPEVEQKGRTKATPALGMVDQRLGRIINIASVVGQIGNIGQVNYAASKGGVIALTRALAKEYGRRGITVNAVCPGYIADTGMTQMMSSQHSPTSSTKDSFTNGNSNPATPLTAVLPQIPLGRLGTPEEVAGLVTFLATHPAAAYMTGHCINIDGGIGIGAT